MKWKFISLMFLLVISMILTNACGDNTTIENASYKNSAIFTDFPVPLEAELTQDKSTNPDTKYEKYMFNKSSETDGLPGDYVTEIAKWGWKENKEKQMGAMRVFEKDGKIIQMTVHNGFFTLSNNN